MAPLCARRAHSCSSWSCRRGQPATATARLGVTVDSCHPGLRVACHSPLAYTIEAFLTDAECDALIGAATPHLRRSQTAFAVSEIRTSETCLLPHPLPAALALLRRVQRLLPGVPLVHIEEVQVARYERGQFYEGHYDGPDVDDPDRPAFMAHGGQRVATVLCYLNDVGPEGGGTCFDRAGLEVRPRRGRALLFFPALADGALDPEAWHEARPAERTKWVAQVWVRQRRTGDDEIHRIRTMVPDGSP